MQPSPTLTTIVVHWHGEEDLQHLLAVWPSNKCYELLVVDNSSSLGSLPPPAKLLDPGCNLGFGGGVNFGLKAAAGDLVLILNPDARPLGEAFQTLEQAFKQFPDAAGIVPSLEGAEGEVQDRWQLQPLPSPLVLLAQVFFLAGLRGPRVRPQRGTAIEQPAAAALAIRRQALIDVGGFDESFFPAWFEDVDLAKRLAGHGMKLIYEPDARFLHAMGGSVPRLGYGSFLWIYYRNLEHYLRLHHRPWAVFVRLLLPISMLLRIVLLPLRCPRRATGRLAAARGLWQVAVGALSGWRRPTKHAQTFTRDSPRSSGNQDG